MYLRENNQIFQIPVEWKKSSQHVNLLATENFTLLPFQTLAVTLMADNILKDTSNLLIHNKDSHIKITCPRDLEENEKDHPFPGNSSDPSSEEELFSVIDALVSRNKNNRYLVNIENNSNYHLDFQTNQQVATLSSMADDMDLYQLSHKSILDPVNCLVEDNLSNYMLNLEDFAMTELDLELEDIENLNTCLCKLSTEERSERDPYVLDENDLQEDQQIADGDHLDHTVGRSGDYIKHLAREKYKNRAIEEAREKIFNDPALNDLEKQQALNDFIQNGFVSQSCSSIIDNNPHVSELKDSSEIPLTDQEILDKIKVDHLDPGKREKVLNLCRRYLDIFPRTEFSIPENSWDHCRYYPEG